MRVVVAMSGGVDSSVAAALLADAGHEVIGVSMQLYDHHDRDELTGTPRFGSCCTLDDLHDARRAAAAIGVPHYIMNFERQFTAAVVGDFVREYVNGRTPIPCTHCNSDLKFSTLLERAAGFGADGLATGHYARVSLDTASGRYELRRGVDATRDQSYFLFGLGQAQLARAHFPIGELPKTAVRQYARDRGLPVADKAESREICFVPNGDYAGFVERHTGRALPEGDIVDDAGRVVGRHRGIHRYTVGQRKGLGVAAPAPLYVMSLDPESNRVVVGPRDRLERTTCTVTRVNWIAGTVPSSPAAVQAQVRYKHRAAPATVSPLGDGVVQLTFDAPQPAIAPGQAAVFYQEDVVLGGGWIGLTK
jgi:tRNA-specific 2-thiouridylase